MSKESRAKFKEYSLKLTRREIGILLGALETNLHLYILGKSVRRKLKSATRKKKD